jgi:hypothetical protein
MKSSPELTAPPEQDDPETRYILYGRLLGIAFISS